MTWPYPDPEQPIVATPPPSWHCPDDDCQCHAVTESEDPHEVSVVLLAETGERMQGAACRVHYQGRVINDTPNADGDGKIKVKLPRAPTTFLVEWAPSDTPIEPRYPYRAQYHVHLGEDRKEAGRRRLANLGFWIQRTLEDNVSAFQRRYGHARITGELSDIEADLQRYHDQGCPPITRDERGGGSGKGLSLAPGEHNAKLAPDDPKPQPPLAQDPSQGSVQVPAPFDVDIWIDWGHRPRRTGAAEKSSSFWIDRDDPPLEVARLDTFKETWVTDKGTPLSVTSLSKTQASVTLPATVSLIRLTFQLKATIDGNTRTVLKLHQLFQLNERGELMSSFYAFDDFTMERSGSPGGSPTGDKRPPSRKAGVSKVAKDGLRTGLGLHPLLWLESDLDAASAPKGRKGEPTPTRLTKRVFVNAEFVDATELWWDVHSEDNTVYLSRAFPSRAEHLRVLAWTGGGLPMIWFAVVPDASLSKVSKGDADIVFYRPPPGLNSFAYDPTEAGFSDTRHNGTTMLMLSRYLLEPLPRADLLEAFPDGHVAIEGFSEQIQPKQETSDPKDPTAKPDNPMDLAALSLIGNYATLVAFRPCGFEARLNRVGASHVMLLPLGADSHPPGNPNKTLGYEHAVNTGLKDKVMGALHLLWTRCAIARDDSDPPRAAERPLWIGGHSAGNIFVWSALGVNGDDVSRVMSFSATPKDDNLGTARSAIARRSKKSGDLEFFLIAAPDMTGRYTSNETGKSLFISGHGVDQEILGLLPKSGISLTVLPPVNEHPVYYVLHPATMMNPFLRNLLGKWTDAEIDRTTKTTVDAHAWGWLFFHEYPVYGKMVEPNDDPSAPQQLRSFFELALGPPRPMP